jgi:hypothetical protein
MIRLSITAVLMVLLPVGASLAQGQDSSTWDRDRQVIGTLLAGAWDNTNQVYFDKLTKVGETESHTRLHALVDRLPYEDRHDYRFSMRLQWQDLGQTDSEWIVSLANDDTARVVAMTLHRAGDSSSDDRCVVLWRREAAQFRGTADGSGACDGLPTDWVLSERQLWMFPLQSPDEASPPRVSYKLHRVRPFECFVDMPGVGGGRDEPYERYAGFKIHDGGGSFRLRPKHEPERELGVSLWRVDWPVNNYEGVFTRDVLVISVSEFFADGSRQEHGYSFTVPDADRIGVNLKWLLASCYMKSNAVETPFM